MTETFVPAKPYGNTRIHGAAVLDRPANLQATLDERGSNYGPFSGHADAAQSLKSVVRWHLARNDRYSSLSPVAKATIDEGLDMIMHKVARLINGDPLHDDSWVDIAGYATITNKFANEANK